MFDLFVPVGKFEEEETFQAWTETSTSRCEVLHCTQDQTLQGKRSENRFSLYRHFRITKTNLIKESGIRM